MAEVAASRPPAGLSLSAENLHALEPAPLDDLVESEVIVGDDSDDEFAFNGEVKDTEEIYIQNGPRGPSMTVGHLTIEHSYCTPETDDEPAVKLVDPDRFSDFFLMEEAATSPAGGVGHVQLFSDMRQCVSGGALSYLQVTSAAVLSSLQQAGRRLESLTEEDESEAAQEPPPARAAPAPAPAAAALSPPTGSGAPAVAASAVTGDAGRAADMAAAAPGDTEGTDVWGAGVGVQMATVPAQPAAAPVSSAETARPGSPGRSGELTQTVGSADYAESAPPIVSATNDTEATQCASAPVSTGGTQPAVAASPNESTQTASASKPSELAQTASASKPSVLVQTASASKPSELTQTASASKPSELTQSTSASKPSELTQTASVSKLSELAQTASASKPSELAQLTSAPSPTDPTQSVSAPSPSELTQSAATTSPTGLTQSVNAISFSEMTQSVTASSPTGLTQSATVSSLTEMTQSVTVPSPTGLTQSLGPVSFSDPFSVSDPAPTEAAVDMTESISLVSPVEPATEISGPVSLVGIVLPVAVPAVADGPSSGSLWGAAATAAADNTAALPVLKIDERVELKGEGERDGASSSDRSTPPRLGRTGKAAAARPAATRASPRGSLTARAQADLAKTRSSSATREEKRSLSSYGTLPRRSKKSAPPESAKKDELSAVSEITRKQPAVGRPGAKLPPTSASAPLRRRPLDKKVSELKKSESAPAAGSELGRGRKSAADAELKSSADKYGTLTRRKEPKATADGAAGKSAPFTAEELKRGADTFGTLGRRKKTAAAPKPAAPARSDTTAKPAATAASSRPASNSSSKTPSPRPAPTAAAAAAARRPAAARPAARPAARAAAANKTRERTLICLETACQTVLTGGDLSAASLRPRPAVQCQEADCQADITSPLQAQQAAELARLQAEAERARQALDQLQQLKMELGAARRQLEEERADKLEVQEELGRTTVRVQDMMGRMEGVERELQQHQHSLLGAEQRAQTADSAAAQLQHELELSQAAVTRLSEDLEKSVAAQKTLLQQVQETEAESCELHEFMQLEKNALVDALREAENEVASMRTAAADGEEVLRQKEERCAQLTRLAEQRAEEMSALKAELRHVQSRTKELLLCQGAGVSGASVALSQLAARLEIALRALLPAHLLTDLELPLSSSVPARLAEAAPPPRRSASLAAALAGPPRSLSQMVRALDLPAGETLADERPPMSGGDSLQELAVRHLLEGRDSPEGEESCSERGEGGEGTGLDEQVHQVDMLVDRLIRAAATLGQKTDDTPAPAPASDRPSPSVSSCEQELRERLARLEAENAELRRQPPHPAHTPDTETASLRQELGRKDRQLEELKQKYTKHKQILTENVQKAESEIQTLDEIIDYVIVSLSSVPEVVQKQSVLWKLWLDLDGPNKTVTKSKLNGTTPISDLNANADIVKV